MVTETSRITYRGGAATVGALAQMLRQEGVRVEYEAPEEKRDLASIAEAVFVTLAAEGARESIKFAVAKFRKHFPRAEVEIEGDEDNDRD